MARNPNIDDDTRARAMKFVEDASMPRPAVTAKPNMPKQRGLTRRRMSVAEAKKQLNLGERPSAKSVSDAKAQLGLDEPAQTPRYMTNKSGTNVNYENEDATSETFKKGGRVSSASKRADGCAVRGKTRA
jgi:hypothetical protein